MGIPDSSYKIISKEVYNTEPDKAVSNNKNQLITGDPIVDVLTKKQYQVIAVQDNNNDVDPSNDNGMQAMAVAPVENGEVDTTQIVIAYAGTNSVDFFDYPAIINRGPINVMSV
ncbi:hypothetical protein [Streptococcus marimammalium]|uniref:hypothetical protein n=1 Tax=Streptococcus marimammalium TaxID=269666 RepID=UPI00037BFCBB|nr:hypothetical protein [Streptococcus marimammalium]